MTPGEVLSHPPRILTPERRRYYFKNGYVSIERAVERTWLDRLRAASDEMVERSQTLTQSVGSFVLENEHSRDHPRLRRLSNPIEHQKEANLPTIQAAAASTSSAGRGSDY